MARHRGYYKSCCKATDFESKIIFFVGIPLYFLLEHPIIFWLIATPIIIFLAACLIKWLKK